jgi:antitoxin component YwqK of YwqJK toxin-antitoxin module
VVKNALRASNYEELNEDFNMQPSKFLFIVIIFLFGPCLWSQGVNALDHLGRRQGLWILPDPVLPSIQHVEQYYTDGIPNGTYRQYYTYKRKQLIGEGFFNMGKMEGDYKEYWDNGKQSKHYYYKNGKREGYQYWYHQNGNLDARMYCVDNKLSGNLEGFDKLGKLETTIRFTNGVPADSTFYYDKSGFPIFVLVHYYNIDSSYTYHHITLNKNKHPLKKWKLQECLPSEYTGALSTGIFDEKSGRSKGWEFIHPQDFSKIMPMRKKRKIKIYFDEKGNIKNKTCPCQNVKKDIEVVRP